MQRIKEFRLAALVFGLISLFVSPLIYAATPLLPLAKGDLQAQQIAKAPDMVLANTAREPVNFAWALEATPTQIVSGDNPYEAESRSYRLLVTGKQLNAGVMLTTTAAGALVRLHPVDSPQRVMPALGDLEIVSAGRTLRGASAMTLLGNAEALAATPLGAQQGTIAFRLTRELGAGRYALRSATALPDDALYAVNVYDQYSDVVLRARADRGAYFSGETLRTEVVFDAKGPAAALDAFLLTPDGARLSATVVPTGERRYEITAEAAYATAPGELWELHANGSVMVDGVAIPRAVKTAFAVTHASARFDGAVSISRDTDLRIALPVAVAADGRYEARAVLFGSDAQGTLHAIAGVAAARWIATGNAPIELVIDSRLVADSGLQAPFELRDLRLIDQSRMSTLHRQARAVQFD